MTCSKCARDVAAGQAWCEVCKGPAVFSARELQSLQVDVRARVLWGESAEEIRNLWLKKGAPIEAIRSSYAEAMRERQRHFRKLGLRDLFMSFGFILLAAGAVWLEQGISHGTIKVPTKAKLLVIAAMLAFPVTGAVLGIRGVGRLIRGGEKEKSASDLA